MPTFQIWCQLGSILGALGHPGVHFGQCFEVLGLSFRFGRAQGMHKWIFQRFCVSFGIHLEQFFEPLEALGVYFERLLLRVVFLQLLKGLRLRK